MSKANRFVISAMLDFGYEDPVRFLQTVSYSKAPTIKL